MQGGTQHLGSDVYWEPGEEVGGRSGGGEEGRRGGGEDGGGEEGRCVSKVPYNRLFWWVKISQSSKFLIVDG